MGHWLARLLLAACICMAPVANAQRSGSVDLSGKWKGAYAVDAMKAEMVVVLWHQGRRLDGSAMEDNAAAGNVAVPRLFSFLEGEVGQDGIVTFDKTYNGVGGPNSTVRYQGRYDSVRAVLTGTWSTRGMSGPFALRRIPDNLPLTPRIKSLLRADEALSKTNRTNPTQALRLFGDTVWSASFDFNPSIRTDRRLKRGSPDSVEIWMTEVLDRNRPLLLELARKTCATLSAEQSSYLSALAMARGQRLLQELRARESSLEKALGKPLTDRIRPTPAISVAPACDSVAQTTGASITISQDLILFATLSSIFVDGLFAVVPPRALRAIARQEYRTQPDGAWDPLDGSNLLFRALTDPLWRNGLRGNFAMRAEEAQNISIGKLEAELLRQQCKTMQVECVYWSLLGRIATSAAKIEILQLDQIDFMIGHEIGHYALGHNDLALGDCASEREIEADADRFAVALMRPEDGLFFLRDNPSTAVLERGFDRRFGSGIDLFMMETHRLSLLQDGDACAYPPWRDRLERVRAFERSAYGG